MINDRSRALFEKAQRLIPGGVNSPVRAGKAVGMDPPFIARAEGCHLWDVDGNRYIDYVCSWGPLILGHAHPAVVRALQERIGLGTSYGAPTELEVEMAETITRMFPSMEMVRMVNSGTEAAMSAIRLARGFTGRERIVKFEGCYHGHGDSLLVAAGSGVATYSIPGCPGVPEGLASQTLCLPFNDPDAVAAAFERQGEEIAAVIVEPIVGNIGVVLPKEGFLEKLRETTTRHGALLIFDEVITGFRVSPGGAQRLYGITPDLTCLGKIIGGGLPVGAYGGKREIMLHMAPEGRVYQAGTLSGNPLAMAAGLATLKVLQEGKVYEDLERKGKRLFSGLEEAARSLGVPIVVNRVGSMGSFFFSDRPVANYDDAMASDSRKYRRFHASMLQGGIYLAPSAFESWFLSTAHDEESLNRTIERAREGFATLTH